MVKLETPTNLATQEGSKTVINLTRSFKLSSAQLALLNKGLNFIPTKGTNRHIREQSLSDMQQYHRKLKLAAYYEHARESVQLPFIQKSAWTPQQGQIPDVITALIQADMHYFNSQFEVHRVPPNLTAGEVRALTELANNKHIVIKPADKGSAIVIMDREQYIWEGYRQLNDPRYYTKLTNPIYPNTIPIVNKIIQTLQDKKFINFKQKNYLMGNSEPRARLFYMLPKIHKDRAKWSKPNEVPPGRPIVSDCSSETYHTAEYLDFFLNPLSTKHASYIKDTYHFVNIVKKLHIPDNSILFTIDIDSLYTNIDIKEGIQAIKNIFRKFPNKNRPEKELLQLLEINLSKNDFEFNGEFFLQIKGTAMGKKFAPAYANIFMAEWEVSALNTCPLKPLYYYRFLDDIWGVWPHSREDFDIFLGILNNHNDSIKIKSISNLTTVDFLDTTTFKSDTFDDTHTLDIKVFFKETDTHALLYKTSFHPKHTYAGLIKSQLLRFHRICTRLQDFRSAVKVLFHSLSTRGYCRTFLRKQHKVFLKTKVISVTVGLPFVATYSPSTVKMVGASKRRFNQYTTGTEILQNHNIIPAFRRNKNIRDLLVRAKIKPLTNLTSRRQGDHFKHLYWFTSHTTKEVFQNLTVGKLSSKNCVYLVTCKQCGLQYVGETGNSISTRFSQHKYNVTKEKKTQTPFVKHFIAHGWESVTTTVIQCNSGWSITQRKSAERVWISRLDTKQPSGLNEG